jgi:hypothetical protein
MTKFLHLATSGFSPWDLAIWLPPEVLGPEIHGVIDLDLVLDSLLVVQVA